MTYVSAQALLFDMDGVLINSIPAVERVWSRWAKDHGFNVQDVLHRAHGRPSIETLRYLLPDADHEAENRLVERAEIEDVADIIPLPGVTKLLAMLPRDRWAIVTSCTRSLAEVRMRAAGLPTPGVLITSNDITRGKPDPEPYLAGAKLLGLRPEECLVIEDAASGAKAGHAAGCKVLATLFSHSLESLSAADWVVRSLKDVQMRFDGEWIEAEFEPLARPVAAS